MRAEGREHDIRHCRGAVAGDRIVVEAGFSRATLGDMGSPMKALESGVGGSGGPDR